MRGMWGWIVVGVLTVVRFMSRRAMEGTWGEVQWSSIWEDEWEMIVSQQLHSKAFPLWSLRSAYSLQEWRRGKEGGRPGIFYHRNDVDRVGKVRMILLSLIVSDEKQVWKHNLPAPTIFKTLPSHCKVIKLWEGLGTRQQEIFKRLYHCKNRLVVLTTEWLPWFHVLVW